MERAYLLHHRWGWTLIPMRGSGDWSELWNEEALPLLQEFWTSPFIPYHGTCRDPVGRAALLAFHLGLNGLDPDKPDPFWDAFPRMRLKRVKDGASLIYMGFSPEYHPTMLSATANWLENQPAHYVFDPVLQCDTRSKRALSILLGIGGRADWPAIDRHRKDLP